jgi:hypothetical protein
MTLTERPVDTRTPRVPVRRWILGDHPWGRVETRVLDRAGAMVQHVLVVYPPGTSDRERSALWWARTWPWAGAVAGIGALMLFGDLLPDAVILSVVGLGYAAGVLVGVRATHRIRPRVRRMLVTAPRDVPTCDDDTRIQSMRRLVAGFADLDRRAANGLIDAVQYEAEWSRLYATLDPAPALR